MEQNNSTVMTASESGLSNAEAEDLTKKYGLNEIKEKKAGLFIKIWKWVKTPIALMLFAAAILSLIDKKFFDFYFILFLIVVNFSVQFYEENKADNAIEKLEEKLAISVRVKRDGEWKLLESRYLVPGDLVRLNVGDLVPADCKLINPKNLTINEAVLTGESLTKEKNAGDTAYSGSFVATGDGEGIVTATGRNTYFGKTITLVDRTTRRSILEKDILSISKFLSILSLIAVFIVIGYFLLFKNAPITDLVRLGLSLVIAGIPVSLPTVMTLIITLGVLELAKKNAIVRRLSALEDLANVNLLLSDKTGTLSKNEINIVKIIPYSDYTVNDVLLYAYAASDPLDKSVISQAIVRKGNEEKIEKDFKIIDLIPADSDRKRATATIEINGERILSSVGASQIIESLLQESNELKAKLENDVREAAGNGYRTLAVAISRGGEEKSMSLVGTLLLSDTLQPGTNEVMEFMKSRGIAIKMLTGDNHDISVRVAGELGFEGEVLSRKDLEKVDWDALKPEWLNGKNVFSEILPIDKYHIAQLAKKSYVVAVTGDGINDLPAIKTADVGIAVENAVDALKSAADMVLLTPGLSVIKDAIVEARRIFARLYTYSLYRISESFRLIVTIAVLGLVYGNYPITPLQILIIALLNDLPIISLGYDRVKIAMRPARINTISRLKHSLSFGLAGTANSLVIFVLMVSVFHFSWNTIQTVFFLKLIVSGQMLIYVAHTAERWWKYLPSKTVIFASLFSQVAGTLMAYFGFLMPKIPVWLIIFVWVWAFGWMQITELTKIFWAWVERKRSNPVIPQELQSGK
ncbi:MAG: plasma-membrane proton-efflux P-type ATPase [Patescibacteria group bacterium]|nr:plasma-membrane proton-efflux P-type ATPase [Patescibacteria group bacterium]